MASCNDNEGVDVGYEDGGRVSPVLVGEEVIGTCVGTVLGTMVGNVDGWPDG